MQISIKVLRNFEYSQFRSCSSLCSDAVQRNGTTGYKTFGAGMRESLATSLIHARAVWDVDQPVTSE
jgi:hypothetical protein